MNESHPWWLEEAPRFLDDTLAHINQANRRTDAVDRCEDLCKALNKTWNAHFAYRRRRGELTDKEASGDSSDTEAFDQLFLSGLDDALAEILCRSESVANLAAFTPQVMNHDILNKRGYDPSEIGDPLRKEASEAHRKLLNAFRRYHERRMDRESRESLLKKLRQLIYVVRCNIAHSEKTPRGPDLGKSERDRGVCEVVSAVIMDLFELLFERPSRRLAAYGTLRPGEPNHSVVADLVGEWTVGTVRGELGTDVGFPVFRWTTSGPEVEVMVLTSDDLPDHYPRIDRFEGSSYERVWVPVMCGSSVIVANIYQGI